MAERSRNISLENQYWDRYRARFAWTAVVCGAVFAILDAGGPLAILQVYLGGSDSQWGYVTGRWIIIGGLFWGGLLNLLVAAPGKAYIVEDGTTALTSDDNDRS